MHTKFLLETFRIKYSLEEQNVDYRIILKRTLKKTCKRVLTAFI